MNTLLIFLWIWAAMIANSFWESSVEGRNAWNKKKEGWKFKLFGVIIDRYHFYLYVIMWPLALSLPLIINGWNTKLFGILLSAYISGTIIEDFGWYVVNPIVKLKEFWTDFSDYYPWIKFRGRKIIPLGYLLGIIISVLSWYFLWR